MSSSILLVYFIATISLSITPGPTMLLALSNGTTRNKSVVGMGILGASLGNILLITAVSLGLGAMMQTSMTLFNVVKWGGTLYLVWLAIQLWRQKPNVDYVAQSSNKNSYKAFLRCFLVAISNPKGLLFFTAFLPQFISMNQPQFYQYAVLASITISIDAIVMLIYALGGTKATVFLTYKGLKRLNQGCSIMMFSLAVMLAVYKKS